MNRNLCWMLLQLILLRININIEYINIFKCVRAYESAHSYSCVCLCVCACACVCFCANIYINFVIVSAGLFPSFENRYLLSRVIIKLLTMIECCIIVPVIILVPGALPIIHFVILRDLGRRKTANDQTLLSLEQITVYISKL